MAHAPSSLSLSLASLFDDDVDENAPTAPGIVVWPDWARDPRAEGEPVLEDPSSWDDAPPSWDDVTKPFATVESRSPRS
jgi:hypothetical protein